MGLKSISITYTGDHDETSRFLKNLKGKKWVKLLDKYGKQGVEALRQATPKDTGKTSEMWGYEIEMPEPGRLRLVFTNNNIRDDWANIAILIQYGHSSRNGSWVEGIDYINPALQGIFERLSQQAWQEVENS